MNQIAFLFALLCPTALFCCAFLPRNRGSFARKVGARLPWFVFAGSIYVACVTFLAEEPIPLQIPFIEDGPLGRFSVILLDSLSAVMLILASFLGAIIARFARNYMEGELRETEFYRWFCITIGSVFCIILSGNLLLFTLAWMATSLSFHQLLVFFPKRPAAQLAAKKKFIISRIGDLCLIGAMIWTGALFGTLDFPDLFEKARAMGHGTLPDPGPGLHGIALLLSLGALLKSAQFPFHTWLPDTLETPTPVSAILHAGIINAGGYLIVRLSPIIVLSSPSLSLIAVIGAFTAVFAGLVMLTQTSIKKTLAFSTVAQMGFMMLQCGLGFFALAVLHIVAHSLYKAYAFLHSGELQKVRAPLKPISPATLIVGAGLAVIIFVAVTRITGGFTGSGYNTWVLGVIVTLGLGHFLITALSGKASWKAARLFKACMVIMALSATYALLHAGAGFILTGVVAPAPESNGIMGRLLQSGIVLLFAFGFGLPLYAASHQNLPCIRRFQLHASHGFYCNTWINRIFQRRLVGDSYQEPAVRGLSGQIRKYDSNLVEKAAARIPPLWPLKHFVPVNPFLGHAKDSFNETATLLKRVVGANIVPGLDFFRRQLAGGNIRHVDLEGALADIGKDFKEALQASGMALTAESLRAAALDPDRKPHDTTPQKIKTFASFYDGKPQGYWQRMITEDISRRCAAFYDQVQSSWRLPFPGDSLYGTWKSAMKHDYNMDVAGIPGFSTATSGLPDRPEEVPDWALHTLQIPPELAEDFLHVTLFSIKGWAGYCQHLRHNAKLHGRSEKSIIDLLAIRLVYDVFLFQSKADAKITGRWRTFLETGLQSGGIGPDPELALRCILQDAFERSHRSRLFNQITGKRRTGKLVKGARPSLQAVFCIDVRSEVYRRALEAQSATIETVGFAGFFGLPIAYADDEETEATARCPVLLAPSIKVKGKGGCTAGRDKELPAAWKAFEKDAPSCFSYVETVGLCFGWKSLRAAFPGCGESLQSHEVDELVTTLTTESKAALGAAILRNLGLEANLAENVLFMGHGSTTRNNPHASGLDCGACGGHAGDENARFAASILNDPEVRETLQESHGIQIPDDTHFLAGLHNTTTDRARIFPGIDSMGDRAAAIERIQAWLDAASAQARVERAPTLGLKPFARVHERLRVRANDWSQVRPEWGLAGNYAFIAAPRKRTRALNLKGRVFLHNYEAGVDQDNEILTMILTAPVIVAGWINLQYYGSTVDPLNYGAGSKLIHNIAAGIGVLAGNGGDLLSGLPVQSLVSPDKAIHDPIRLQVIIEADTEDIDSVLRANESIREFVENQWLHLFAIVEDGGTILRRRLNGSWVREPHPDQGEDSVDHLLAEPTTTV